MSPEQQRKSSPWIRPAAVPLVALVLALGGCGGGGAADEDPGTLRVAVSLDEAAPVLGRNTALIEVSTAAGEPVEAAEVTASPWMPAHGHGSTEEPTVTALGGGRYRAYPVTFFMAGDWQLKIRADARAEFGSRVASYAVR